MQSPIVPYAKWHFRTSYLAAMQERLQGQKLRGGEWGIRGVEWGVCSDGLN